MRHSLTQFICLAVMLVVAGECNSDTKGESDKQTARSKPICVLFIGNSQFGLWNIPQMVQELSESASSQGTRLTGKSPIGLTNKCGKGAVSTEEARPFQSAAWEQYLETNPRKQP